VKTVFKCSTRPHFIAMIKANRYQNCPKHVCSTVPRATRYSSALRLTHTCSGGSSGSGNGGSRDSRGGTSRQLPLRHSGTAVLFLYVSTVVMQPATGVVAASSVPVDGHTPRLCLTRRTAGFQRRDARQLAGTQRVGARERAPWHADARHCRRRRR